MEAELVIRFQAFRSKYLSHIALSPPAHEGGSAFVRTELLEGPFSYLTNAWLFEAVQDKEGKSCTRITFDLDFRFQSSMLESMVGGVFSRATAKMVEAFEKRAEVLYGENK